MVKLVKSVTPAVSVVIPMHNAERHIQDTLQSLASQSLMDFEVIVVDDGSTDRSASIVDAFVASDRRFRRIEGPAIGSAGAARNVGLGVARGEYLGFLDADDLYAPSMLEKLYSKAKADRADVVLSGFSTLDDVTGIRRSQPWALRVDIMPAETPFSPEDVADHLFYFTNPANWNKLFRRAFVEEAGIAFQPLRRANDAYFTYLSLARAQRLTYVAEELVEYRVSNTTSLQGSVHETPLEFVEAISGIYESLVEAGIYGRHERAFMNLVASMSVGALSRAKTAEAFATTYEALRHDVFPRNGLTDAPSRVFLSSHLRQRVAEIIAKPVSAFLFDRAGMPGGPPLPEPTVSHEVVVDAGGEPDAEDRRPAADPAVPDVSVIVPVYNAAAWLHECLLSVLGQTGVSVEVICVNDGSTDESASILQEYASSDPRIVVVDRPNGGLSAARNSGLEVASGRYVCMLDSDDYWRTDDLSNLVEIADRDALDLLLFDAEAFFEPGVSEATHTAYATYYTRTRAYSTVVTGPELMAELNDAREYRPSACLYLVRTALLRDAELTFIPGIMHEDNPFTFALFLNAARAAHVDLPIYARRMRPGSIMTGGAAERSMRGYFAAYLDMKRRLVHHPVGPELAPQIGDVIHRMFAATRRLFLELPEDVGARIQEVDPTPEAYSIYMMMRHERNQTLKIQRLTKAA
ncbi:glycosyltransferase [Microbacterium sp. 1.5R]|uniref:glycosyltransferase n=1 Tax=Microbacterium sp. 1.5R TaxID=1916917 RepID=UPI0028CB46B5|nr:glycosyltransferase [Microbacterium sp. 1.5R]